MVTKKELDKLIEQLEKSGSNRYSTVIREDLDFVIDRELLMSIVQELYDARHYGCAGSF